VTFTDLGSPVPEQSESVLAEQRYPVLDRRYLPVPTAFPAASFFDVIERRMTRRTFSTVPLPLLSMVLWSTARMKTSNVLPSGFVWQHRPVTSAGGRHPIDLLVLQCSEGVWSCSVYDEQAHALCRLGLDQSALSLLLGQIEEVVPPQDGTVIWHVARPQRTLTKYRHGSSLIWRDSGVLTGHMALVCEALGLNFCALGITGEPFVSSMLNMADVVGVGGAVIGLCAAREA